MFQQLFKKILPRASHRDIRKSRLSPSDRRAYELGEKFAANMARQIEEYIKKRSDNIKGNYIAILRQHLDKALHQELHSPLLVARVELEVFMENVDGACQKLIEETVGAANAEWGEVLREMNIDSSLHSSLIVRRVNEQFADLKLVGLNTLAESADILKKADDEWRERFPDLAAVQPLD